MSMKAVPVFLFAFLLFFAGESSYSQPAPGSSPAAGSAGLVKSAELPPDTPDMGPVYGLSVSPDARFLATADYDTIHIWDLASLEETRALEGHGSFVWGLAWSPDGSEIASASQDGTVALWNAADGSRKTVLNTGWAFSVSWSPDGKLLAVGGYGGSVQLWDPVSGTRTYSWNSGSRSPVICCGWSPDGRRLAAGKLNGLIEIWDAKTGKPRILIEGYTSARCDANGMAWSPDGKTLATAHQDGRVRIWNPRTGKAVRTLVVPGGWTRGIAWSSDGTFLTAGGESGLVRVWDGKTLEFLTEGRNDNFPVWCLAWLPGGERLVSGSGRYDKAHTGSTVIWVLYE